MFSVVSGISDKKEKKKKKKKLKIKSENGYEKKTVIKWFKNV
jgi:hypothetical protein